tara:strand:- start:111 stop:1232 length:1122 start_codon:yes stop_codon:yes gene_type:complete
MSLDNNTKAQLDALVDKFDQRIERAIDKREVEAKKSIFSGSSYSSTDPNLKREWKGVQDVFNRKSLEHNVEFKTITIGGSSGDVVGEFNAGTKDVQRSYFDITSVMPTFNVPESAGEYRYIINDPAGSNNFNAVSENSDSAESSVNFKEVSAKPENIRSYFLASREIADDVQGFQSFVQQRGFQMLIDQINGQVLLGNGTSPNLNGLLNADNRTAFDYTASNTYFQSVDNANFIDCLIVGINNLLEKGFSADMILVNPAQFGQFSLLKDSTGEYLKNPDFRITGSNSAVVNGVPIYASNKMSNDGFYIADTSKAFGLVRKGGLNLRVTSEGQELFKKNLVMMELSARLQTLVLNKECTILGDFSDAVTSLETP